MEVIEMPTSKPVAKEASKQLKSNKETKPERSVAGSALSQASDKGSKKKGR